MKANEIRVGGKYIAKVGGNLTTVKVDAIEETKKMRAGKLVDGTVYRVTNTATNRKTTFDSAAKFRAEAQSSADVTPAMEKAEDTRTQYEIEEDSFRNGGDDPGPEEEPVMDIAQVLFGATIKTPPIGGQHGPSPAVSLAEADRLHAARELAKLDAAAAPKGGVTAYLEQRKAMTAPSTIKPLAFGKQAPHIIVEARAGTGKTTTLIEGFKLIYGMHISLTPTEQQRAVWDMLQLEKNPRFSCFAAFNNTIAAELEERVPKVRGCAAKTLHGLGNYAVRRAIRLGDGEPGNNARTSEFVVELMMDVRKEQGAPMVDEQNKPLTPKDIKKIDQVFFDAAAELASKAKQNLLGARHQSTGRYYFAPEVLPDTDLRAMADHYAIELPEAHRIPALFEIVRLTLARCRDVKDGDVIDFDDQVWLPVVLNLPILKNDVLMVDEAQDLNRCQQALAKMAAHRLIFCGDPFQAIYGFAGADAESMRRLEVELTATARGCVRLPLTFTRRCGKAIVREAQKIVPDFFAFDDAHEGLVREAQYTQVKVGKEWQSVPYEKNYMSEVQDGDMILCRANAPLVSQCFKFLKMNRKAVIQGRDVGKTLVALIKRIGVDTIPELIAGLGDWLRLETEKENAQRSPSESKLQNLQDRYQCLMTFCEEAVSVEGIIAKINALFTDSKKTPGIRLSSIHKAKGLEAKRVFYIQGFGPPEDRMKAWQREQEKNLRYVAITRAIEELVYVCTDPVGPEAGEPAGDLAA